MKLGPFIELLMLALLAAACGPNSAGSPLGATTATRAWFDAPLPGTIYRPPNPCQIVAHAASPAGIAVFELTINGTVQPIIPSPETKSSLATLTRDCNLSDPGEYLLRIRAQDSAGAWSNYAETSLIIPAESTTTPPTAPAAVIPRPVDTQAPTPVPGVPGAVSIESVTPDLVYVGDKTCGPLQLTITARATAPKGIQVVVLFYRFQPGSAKGFDNVAMNPAGGDLYSVTLNPSSLLGGSLESDQATLQYQVVVQQIGGDTSIRTPVMADVALQPCGGGSTTTTADCSTYTTKRQCLAHSCNWVAGTGIFATYVCKNP